MFVLVADVELHVRAAQSLKEKRSVISSIVRTLDRINGVAAAEVDHLDLWQRAGLGLAVVGPDPGHVESVMDDLERRIWARTEVDVVRFHTAWWEEDR
jgi:uncharacterized protein YlxP (DUF503 family)